MAENLEETPSENRQEVTNPQKMADAEYAQMEQSMGYGKAPQAQKTAEEFQPPQLISAEPEPEKDFAKLFANIVTAIILFALYMLVTEGGWGFIYLGPAIMGSPVFLVLGVVEGVGYERRTGKRSVGKIWCTVWLIVMLVLFIAALVASLLASYLARL